MFLCEIHNHVILFHCSISRSVSRLLFTLLNRIATNSIGAPPGKSWGFLTIAAFTNHLILSLRKWSFCDFPHLLAAEAEVVEWPHVGELHHFDLSRKGTARAETGSISLYIYLFYMGKWCLVSPDIKTAFHLNKH